MAHATEAADVTSHTAAQPHQNQIGHWVGTSQVMRSKPASPIQNTHKTWSACSYRRPWDRWGGSCCGFVIFVIADLVAALCIEPGIGAIEYGLSPRVRFGFFGAHQGRCLADERVDHCRDAGAALGIVVDHRRRQRWTASFSRRSRSSRRFICRRHSAPTSAGLGRKLGLMPGALPLTNASTASVTSSDG
jgi:hypothetical protein